MPVQILPGFTPEVLPGEMGPALCAAITAEQQRNRFHTDDACDHMNLLSAAAPSSIFILTAHVLQTRGRALQLQPLRSTADYRPRSVHRSRAQI